MGRELRPLLYRRLRAAGQDFTQKYVHHQPWVIAAVLLWAALADHLRGTAPPALAARPDGTALPVSGVSKDPDARYGRGAGGQAEGYKWHAAWAGRPPPEAWGVTPLNAAATAVARG